MSSSASSARRRSPIPRRSTGRRSTARCAERSSGRAILDADRLPLLSPSGATPDGLPGPETTGTGPLSVTRRQTARDPARPRPARPHVAGPDAREDTGPHVTIARAAPNPSHGQRRDRRVRSPDHAHPSRDPGRRLRRRRLLGRRGAQSRHLIVGTGQRPTVAHPGGGRLAVPGHAQPRRSPSSTRSSPTSPRRRASRSARSSSSRRSR